MKPVRFLGDSLERLREFPEDARHDAGYQLELLQRGEQPNDFKPMPSIGKGVEELRVKDESGLKMSPALIASFIRLALPALYTCCTHFRRKHSSRQDGT
jgi:hypothetical protein